MQTRFAPAPIDGPRPYVFLAGSIDMGRAEPWQARVTEALADRRGTLLNPRRPDWDSSWRQSIDEPPFREQVDWELDGLEAADRIAMYLAPGSQAPVSLLELGLFARSGKLVLACPEGFWRRGNVQIVCDRHDIELVDDLEALIAAVAAIAPAR